MLAHEPTGCEVSVEDPRRAKDGPEHLNEDLLHRVVEDRSQPHTV